MNFVISLEEFDLKYHLILDIVEFFSVMGDQPL